MNNNDEKEVKYCSCKIIFISFERIFLIQQPIETMINATFLISEWNSAIGNLIKKPYRKILQDSCIQRKIFGFNFWLKAGSGLGSKGVFCFRQSPGGWEMFKTFWNINLIRKYCAVEKFCLLLHVWIFYSILELILKT